MNSQSLQVKQLLLHAIRIALFVAILLLIHLQHRQIVQATSGLAENLPSITHLSKQCIEGIDNGSLQGQQIVLRSESGSQLGTAIQTSPEGDGAIGFSGPTNLLLVFDTEERLAGIDVLSSGDTRDHLLTVKEDGSFLPAFLGLSRSDLLSQQIDSVSGATLTSLAIIESIRARLGGAADRTDSLRFPTPLSVAEIQELFPLAHALQPDGESPVWQVMDKSGAPLGTLMRTSPAADQVIGYQGPTDALVGLNPQGKAVGIVLRESYDNEPYVGYVREDTYFKGILNGMTLDELASLDSIQAGIEGVSGATMTSQALVDGIVVSAGEIEEAKSRVQTKSSYWQSVSVHDWATIALTIVGTILGVTRLRSLRWLRILFQCAMVAYLGLTAGNLVSQAMLVGWAKHGVPWNAAPGLAFLSLAALILPITTKRNIYCTHLCPHGAAQQLLRHRGPKIRLGGRLRRMLSVVPPLLLAWCVIVGMTNWGFSLVDIEPFNAYIIGIAGGATIAIAIVGLLASVSVPMAYCRFGCPTGAVLQYLRFHARSDRWTIRDWTAVALVGLGVGFLFAA